MVIVSFIALPHLFEPIDRYCDLTIRGKLSNPPLDFGLQDYYFESGRGHDVPGPMIFLPEAIKKGKNKFVEKDP
jgi:hypothetical protein